MDPYGVAVGSAHAPWVYSRLVRYKAAKYPDLVQGDVEPDGAESWEMSPDGLTFTFKLRGNLKLDPRPPTNGRCNDRGRRRLQCRQIQGHRPLAWRVLQRAFA